MRYLLIVMVLALAMTGCKKSEDNTTAASTSTVVPIAPPKTTAVVIPPNTIADPLTPEQVASPERILTQSVFNCADKTSFTAQFKTRDVNILSGKNKPIVLPQQMAASGFWYKNSHYELRGKGRTATLTIAGRKPVVCTAK